MISNPDVSVFTIPKYCSDKGEDIRKIQEAANKALNHVQLLYEEIMSPCSSYSHPPSYSESYTIESPKISPRGKSKENQIIKTCCIPVNELCCNCEKVVYGCNPCRRCNCNINMPCEVHIDKQTSFLQEKSVESVHPSNRWQENDFINSNNKFKFTIPQPFSLSLKNVERQYAKDCKISKLKEEVNNQIDNELKVRAHCKPIPKNTYLPLYSEMVKKNEQRKIERKEKCVEISKGFVKPFNLSQHTKCETTKVKSMSDLPNENSDRAFKAKPVPKNILSNTVSQKLKNKEEIRKLLIAERAEALLKQSSSPFSHRHFQWRHSMTDLSDYDRKNCKVLKPKNIDAITKRLYTKKCKKVMDCWNKKVLQVDQWKDQTLFPGKNKIQLNNISNKTKITLPSHSLPFSHFPVRMSNAAMMREQQIRTEILARKQKEEEQKILEEEIERKKKEAQREILQRILSSDPTTNSKKEIEEKVKSFRASQINREQEYEREIQEIIKRVSKQLLLIERQSKVTNDSLKPKVCGSSESNSDKELTLDSENDSATEPENEDSEASSAS